ncbi:hypothetical protein Cyrtocomes_01088 [Candidatus Cyrtobacter comes]|uniref:Uncharacterized protein n=1 Tax=Candidatus Cyrtobacter comes TaxID=675776 RepID=A0ABU5L999_9RICK|nr:hypothetical protein [Candidatus Cyrtobacter comes]
MVLSYIIMNYIVITGYISLSLVAYVGNILAEIANILL